MKYLVLSLRVRQWTKNLVIFAAVIFAQELTNFHSLLKALTGFILFCLLTGAVYIINDVFDIEQDRAHPIKCRRPIAAGLLPIKLAILFSSFVAVFSLSLSLLLNINFGICAVIYLLLNIAYSLYLKEVVILDVLIVALGFVLRAISGALLIDVEISEWLIICTLLLALFLALGKRRYELIKDYMTPRKSLKDYDISFIDYILSGIIGATIIAYSLYSFSERTYQKLNTKALPLTIPFVIYGLFRYFYLLYRKDIGGSPEIDLLSDKPFIFNIVVWIITVLFIIYL